MTRTTNSSESRDQSQIIALQNVARAVDLNSQLPGNVFLGAWCCFFLVESDRIFGGKFVEAAQAILIEENVELILLVNIDRSEALKPGLAATIVIDQNATAESYDARLRGNGPNDGWIYRVERYVCGSRSGTWCIYCEKDNEIAVIAIRSKADRDRLIPALTNLGAITAAELRQAPNELRFPFDQLTSNWRDELIRNYGGASADL